MRSFLKTTTTILAVIVAATTTTGLLIALSMMSQTALAYGQGGGCGTGGCGGTFDHLPDSGVTGGFGSSASGFGIGSSDFGTNHCGGGDGSC